MPSVPATNTCVFFGCRNKKSFGTGYCQEHGAKRTAKYKQNEKLYNSTAWKETREAMRSMFPICSACLLEGKVKPTAHIDHVIPHRRDADRFMVNLFQGLCIPHHTEKTQLENKGVYRHYTKEGVVDYKDVDYEHLIIKKFHENDSQK
jgi:5-methylcytosine-specific restriction protein A